MSKEKNNLANELSPYLLQHKDEGLKIPPDLHSTLFLCVFSDIYDFSEQAIKKFSS